MPGGIATASGVSRLGGTALSNASFENRPDIVGATKQNDAGVAADAMPRLAALAILRLRPRIVDVRADRLHMQARRPPRRANMAAWVTGAASARTESRETAAHSSDGRCPPVDTSRRRRERSGSFRSRTIRTCWGKPRRSSPCASRTRSAPRGEASRGLCPAAPDRWTPRAGRRIWRLRS